MLRVAILAICLALGQLANAALPTYSDPHQTYRVNCTLWVFTLMTHTKKGDKPLSPAKVADAKKLANDTCSDMADSYDSKGWGDKLKHPQMNACVDAVDLVVGGSQKDRDIFAVKTCDGLK